VFHSSFIRATVGTSQALHRTDLNIYDLCPGRHDHINIFQTRQPFVTGKRGVILCQENSWNSFCAIVHKISLLLLPGFYLGQEEHIRANQELLAQAVILVSCREFLME
jgi:hypothetical protein